MDCGITHCYNYEKECFFKNILVGKPDPKNGCSYCRKMKRNPHEDTEDENGNKIRKTRSDKGQKRENKEKKGKKRKKEENSLEDMFE